MKVYITQDYGRGVDCSKWNRILEKKGIRVYDSADFSFDEIEETIKTSDAYLTFSDMPFGDLSYSACAEQGCALKWGVPFIILRETPEDRTAGGIPIGSILRRENTAVFECYDDLDVDKLADFITDHVEKCRARAEYSSIPEERKPDKPYEGDEPHIFVSYSHKDMHKVFDVIRELQNNGYRVWYDEGIDPASEWDENIAEHISRCSYLIAFISPNYINSQNCRDEISYARDLNKQRLLVYLEDTKLPAGMAMRLMRLQAIHKYKYKLSSDFFEKLFAAQGIGVARDQGK